MAVKVTDNRTTVDEADAVTNFNQGTLNTTDYAEGTGSVSLAVNIATDQIYWSGTAINFTTDGNELIYLWSSNTATQNGWKESTIANSSHGLWIGDGTNDLVVVQAGNDREVFKHADTQVQFQCFVLDMDYLSTLDAAGNIIEVNGTYASFAENAVTDIGAYYVTTSKALGGGYNAFLDIIRYGTGGITVYGGSTSDRGNFLEIVERDRSKSNSGTGADQFYAGGIIREYTAGAYGVQGAMYFGTTSATDDAWFEDENVSITFENRDIGDDKYKFGIQGNSTDSNNFILKNSVISSAGPDLEFIANNDYIDVLTLDTVTFNNVAYDPKFPTDTVTHTLDHEVTNCTFNACGMVSPGTADFTFNVIKDTVSSNAAVTAGTVGTDSWSDITFISPGTGYGLLIPGNGTYDFTNFVFSGYADQAGTATNRAIWIIASGGTVTINNYGSTGISYNLLGTSTVIINNPKTTKLTAEDADGTLIENARVLVETADNGGGAGLPYEAGVSTLTQSSGTATLTASAAHGLATNDYVVVRGANTEEYNKVAQITVTSSTVFTYSVDSGATTPAGGTPVFSYCPLSGLTNASGVISSSKTWPASQALKGWARKSTSTPYYRQTAISIADASDGTDLLVALQPDE